MSEKIEVDDVVQVDPAFSRFGPVFVIVTETRSWGVIGYMMPAPEGSVTVGGIAYIRVPFEHCVRIGPAEWKVGGA